VTDSAHPFSQRPLLFLMPIPAEKSTVTFPSAHCRGKIDRWHLADFRFDERPGPSQPGMRAPSLFLGPISQSKWSVASGKSAFNTPRGLAGMARARETFTPFLVHILLEKVCTPWGRKSVFRSTTRLSPECSPQNKPLSPVKASQCSQLSAVRLLRAETLGSDRPRIVNPASSKIASHYYQWPPFRKKFAPQTQIF
jgi:hypothetical protein